MVEDFNRQDLERRLGRQATSNLIDASTIADLGRLTAAELIVYGDMTAYGLDTERARQRRTVCASKNSEGKCTQQAEVFVNCTIRAGIVGFTGRVVELAAGRILVSAPGAGQRKVTQCDGERPKIEGESIFANLLSTTPPTDSELISFAANQAVDRFTKVISPYKEAVTVTWRTAGDNLSSGDARKAMRGAIAFIQQGQLEEGCARLFRLDENENDFDLTYNVAVCHELRGNLELALATFRQLQRDLLSPDARVSERIAEIERQIADR
ncbi:MAG: hypothetical protein AAFQ85_05950 [Pseudomonadota bacterium]